MIFFSIAMLASLLGLMTLVLRGFAPDARVEIRRRVIAGAWMAFLLLLFYLPPWVILLGYRFFLIRLPDYL
jgi:hypothetical protein